MQHSGRVRTLIVDDSVVYRSRIRAALDPLPWIEVQGVASNGRLALERLSQSMPDLLVLDLEMPELDGLGTLREMQRRGLLCKVIVFSSVSRRGAENTLDALQLGASDFIAKPGGELGAHSPEEKIRELMEPRLRALFPELSSSSGQAALTTAGAYASPPWSRFQPKVVVFGSSTGGPCALEKIFSGLAPPLRCPIVITQHMPPMFTAMLAERLQRVSGIPAAEAVHGEELLSGRIYVAPGGKHLRLHREEGRIVCALDTGPLLNSVRPAVDPLFETASDLFGGSCLGIVLTGMGSDGRIGAEAVKRKGGVVLIQDAATSVVYGMPGAVMAAGAYDRVLNPEGIIQALAEKCCAESRPGLQKAT
jgi:two-component system chemotaxis response regulator CheB